MNGYCSSLRASIRVNKLLSCSTTFQVNDNEGLLKDGKHEDMEMYRVIIQYSFRLNL